MVTFSLVVVRHGVTDANDQKIIQGQSDYPLNDVGRRQALLLGRHFSNCPPYSSFTHSYTSDLARARETAEIILDSLNGVEPEEKGPIEPSEKQRIGLVCDPQLRERRYGVLEGKIWNASVEKQARRSNKSFDEYTPEGGETLGDLYNRASDFFRDLVSRIVSSHSTSLSPEEPVISRDSHSPMLEGQNIRQQQRNANLSNRSSSRIPTHSSKIRRRSSLQPLLEFDSATTTTSGIDREYGEYNHQDSADWSNGTATKEEELNEILEGKQCGCCSPSSGILPSDDKVIPSPVPDVIDLPAKRSIHSLSTLSMDGSAPLDISDPSVPDMVERVRHLSSSRPAIGHQLGVSSSVNDRKMSVQSITSDDGYVPDLDAKILIVTHGGVIQELFRYFVDELGCVMIGGKGAALRRCPNTGASSFMVNVNVENDTKEVQQKDISIICLGLHSKEHLNSDNWSMINNKEKVSCNNEIFTKDEMKPEKGTNH